MRRHSWLHYLAHRVQIALDLDLPFFPIIAPGVIAGSPRAYGIDISHWESSFNPDAALPGLIDFAIFKATEGTTWVDPTFANYYDSAYGKVPILGAYHYLRSGMDARAQVDNLLRATTGMDLDILACDFESANNNMGDAFVETAQMFGYYLKLSRPDVKLLFYTNPSTYDNVVYPGSLRLFGHDVFASAPWDGFWVAQYYFSPSPAKIPDMPRNRSDWVIWQYSEAGNPDMHGTGGWCDQDVFNGTPIDLRSWLGNGSPPPGTVDSIDFPFEGVGRTRGVRFGCSFQALEIQPAAIESARLVYPGGCDVVEDISGDIVSNMTGFSQPSCRPNQLLKIDHVTIHEQAGTEPYFWWDAGALSFDHKPHPLDVLRDASAIKRYLVWEGARNPTPSPAWDEVHPWQLLGAGRDGSTILITVQAPGFNLYRAADLLLEFGVWEGGDLDSGGSGQTKVAGEVFRCTGEVRGVSNFFSLTIQGDGGNMPDKHYETVPDVKTPYNRVVDGVVKGQDGELNPGTVLPYPTGITKQNNKEYAIFDFQALGFTGWVKPINAIETRFLVVVDVTTPPPPPAGEIAFFKSYDADGSELQKWVPG